MKEKKKEERRRKGKYKGSKEMHEKDKRWQVRAKTKRCQ